MKRIIAIPLIALSSWCAAQDLFSVSGDQTMSIEPSPVAHLQLFEAMEPTDVKVTLPEKCTFRGASLTSQGGIAEMAVSEDSLSAVVKAAALDVAYTLTFNELAPDSTVRAIHTESFIIARHLPITRFTVDTAASLNKCSELELRFFPAAYFQFGGTRYLRSREVTITYNTYDYTGGNLAEEKSERVMVDTSYAIQTPCADTRFKLEQTIGKHTAIETDELEAIGVAVFPEIEFEDKVEHNREDKHTDKNVFFDGSIQSNHYSAPLRINLKGNASPSATGFEWDVTNDQTDTLYHKAKRIYSQEDVYNYVIERSGDYLIRMHARNINSGCKDSKTFGLSVSTSELYVPNVFTPNGDGYNDEFRVSYVSVSEYRIRIFSTFGIEVYDSQDITKGWDGTYKGNDMPNGAYYYVIEAKGVDGKEYKKKGTVNLLRGEITQ